MLKQKPEELLFAKLKTRLGGEALVQMLATAKRDKIYFWRLDGELRSDWLRDRKNCR